ncbi:MAG: HAMP domain-containing histidine kinase [Bacteroidales bacterium]|nr:HAMP domain-containing histidine kinase [Bacteroidales bacterium]
MADSLMDVAHMAHNNARIIALADSLEEAGVFSRIKADYWRGYGYYSQWDNALCQQFWYEAVALPIKSREDLAYHGRSANRLSDIMLVRGEYQEATRIALESIQKMDDGDMSINRDYAHMKLVVGCCELHNGNKEQADEYFNKGYEVLMQLIAGTRSEGGPNHLDNIKTAVAGLTTVTRHCLDKHYHDDALKWIYRLEYIIEEYKRQPEAQPSSLDRRQTIMWIYRASALEGLGNHDAAASAYEMAQTFNYFSSPQGKVEAARYLVHAKRWSEAAECYRQLDGVAQIFGAGLTLDNIQVYLLPKFRSNFYSRHNEEALATGIQLCDALDSAIVWNRKDKAAEIAALFHTREIQEENVMQKANLERLRFISSLAVIVLLIIGFLVFVFLRHRSSLRLEEAYQQLEAANAQAQVASKVKTAFLQQISHEVRTPINLLAGFAQYLTTPGVELDEQSKAQIKDGVVENTGRITGLINKILELSDLISHPELERNDHITPHQIGLDAAAKSGINEAQRIQFIIQSAPDAKENEIVTNSHAAVRILEMLLENAMKFTTVGSVILRIICRQEYVLFLVEDTGIGVPSEEAEHIFEHFVQLDEYQEGTGIGLSLARSLARKLGGDVELDTSYRFGARFVFSLPLNGE